MIELGKTYKDKISGFKGVVTGYVSYISGCNQALIVPPVSKDGAKVESHWFDEQRLRPLKTKRITLDNGKTPGFDLMAPKR